MTRIDIERKRGPGVWPWLLALVLVAIAALGIWSYMDDEPDMAEGDLPTQTAPAPAERMDTTADIAPLQRDTGALQPR